ncbi:MAG: hypothetical protein ACI9S8_000614 [Chlamydiales bacterium]|jgi:hypothetical protein
MMYRAVLSILCVSVLVFGLNFIPGTSSNAEEISRAGNLKNQAVLALNQGYLEKAEALYKQAQDILERELGQDDQQVAENLNSLAM